VIFAKFFTDIQVVGSGPCRILATGTATIPGLHSQCNQTRPPKPGRACKRLVAVAGMGEVTNTRGVCDTCSTVLEEYTTVQLQVSAVPGSEVLIADANYMPTALHSLRPGWGTCGRCWLYFVMDCALIALCT